MNYELLGISLYVGSMLVMGYVVSKRIKTDDDYFLAGRSLGPFLATFSIFATWFGAETCIGTAGAVYRHGLGSLHADPLGYAFCLFIMGLFFARLLWSKKITTIPDLFHRRYSPTTERLAALILIPSSIVWASAQIRAFGQILHSTTDFSVNLAIMLAALVVIIYTVFGGLLADAYTDLIQGFALIFGLVFLFGMMLFELGGPMAVLNSIETSRLSFVSSESVSLSILRRLELWLVPILGSLMAQELVSRVVASKSGEVARSSALRASALYLLVGLIPVFIGLVGLNLFPDLQESETIMPLLAKKYLSPFFFIIFVGALVSAILSTVDSTLLSASALLSHNLIYPQVKNLTEKKKVFIARSGVLLAGLISTLIAFLSTSITDLVEMASSLGGPSIFVLTLIALYEKRGTAWNANLAIGVSLLTWFVSQFVWESEFPILLTVGMCAVSYYVSVGLTASLSKN